MKISAASDSSTSRPLKGFNSNFLGAVLSGGPKRHKGGLNTCKHVNALRLKQWKNVPDTVQLSATKG